MKASEKGGQQIAPGYAMMQVMDNMRLSPEQYAGMHRWDRLLLAYYARLKGYYERKAWENSK